ncbi:MAG: hypothetical protein WC758_05030 [Candidatus Woesearchaeota archaeon]|jgi:hypothetical protein
MKNETFEDVLNNLFVQYLKNINFQGPASALGYELSSDIENNLLNKLNIFQLTARNHPSADFMFTNNVLSYVMNYSNKSNNKEESDQNFLIDAMFVRPQINDVMQTKNKSSNYNSFFMLILGAADIYAEKEYSKLIKCMVDDFSWNILHKVMIGSKHNKFMEETRVPTWIGANYDLFNQDIQKGYVSENDVKEFIISSAKFHHATPFVSEYFAKNERKD